MPPPTPRLESKRRGAKVRTPAWSLLLFPQIKTHQLFLIADVEPAGRQRGHDPAFAVRHLAPRAFLVSGRSRLDQRQLAVFTKHDEMPVGDEPRSFAEVAVAMLPHDLARAEVNRPQ